MPIAAADLMSPAGPVEGYLFPGEDSNVIEARLAGYVDAAYNDERIAGQTDAALKDKLARPFALYRVYASVVERLSANPATITVSEKGGHGYTAEQIKTFKDLAAKYWSDFLGLLVIPPALPPSQLPGSMSVRATVEW
jgi:hypothetical protein